MSVSISHPTDRPNFSHVTIGDLDLYFSYSTIIAYRVGWGSYVVRENDWSATTGKHLNYVSSDKSARIPGEVFEVALSGVLKAHNL